MNNVGKDIFKSKFNFLRKAEHHYRNKQISTRNKQDVLGRKQGRKKLISDSYQCIKTNKDMMYKKRDVSNRKNKPVGRSPS